MLNTRNQSCPTTPPSTPTIHPLINSQNLDDEQIIINQNEIDFLTIWNKKYIEGLFYSFKLYPPLCPEKDRIMDVKIVRR